MDLKLVALLMLATLAAAAPTKKRLEHTKIFNVPVGRPKTSPRFKREDVQILTAPEQALGPVAELKPAKAFKSKKFSSLPKFKHFQPRWRRATLQTPKNADPAVKQLPTTTKRGAPTVEVPGPVAELKPAKTFKSKKFSSLPKFKHFQPRWRRATLQTPKNADPAVKQLPTTTTVHVPSYFPHYHLANSFSL
jgi:hypothetical protein